VQSPITLLQTIRPELYLQWQEGSREIREKSRIEFEVTRDGKLVIRWRLKGLLTFLAGDGGVG
jgi:hypothetical protein